MTEWPVVVSSDRSVTSCRGVKSKARIVHTGVPQGSKMSPTLFSFYLADMTRPTKPVKRICYADDITVWASGVTGTVVVGVEWPILPCVCAGSFFVFAPRLGRTVE